MAETGLEETESRDGFGRSPASFTQQLGEVQLLLDYLSGSEVQKLPTAEGAAKAGLPPEWLRQVCEVTWPTKGSEASQAEQEALLIRVKDYLNSLAWPASGASVSFTVLVAQEEPAGRRRAATEHEGVAAAGQDHSRTSFARLAYPGYARKALKYRAFVRFLAIGLAVGLFLTCGLAGYLVYLSALVSQLNLAQTNLDTATTQLSSALLNPSLILDPKVAGDTGDSVGGICAAAMPAREAMAISGPGAAPSPPVRPATPAPANKQAPAAGTATPGQVPPAYLSADAVRQLCYPLYRAMSDIRSTQRRVRLWAALGGGGREEPITTSHAATAWIVTLSTSVLPVFYGLLGAAAAVLRGLSRRTRTSQLMPRDLTLSVQQLALGAVIGACVGIFIPPASTEGSGGSELFGSVKLSASALSFIAGFGVEAVFAALEGVINRIFNIAPPSDPRPT